MKSRPTYQRARFLARILESLDPATRDKELLLYELLQRLPVIRIFLFVPIRPPPAPALRHLRPYVTHLRAECVPHPEVDDASLGLRAELLREHPFRLRGEHAGDGAAVQVPEVARRRGFSGVGIVVGIIVTVVGVVV